MRCCGHDTGSVGHGHAQLVRRPAREACVEQPPAVLGGGVVPGRHRVAVGARQRARARPGGARRPRRSGRSARRGWSGRCRSRCALLAPATRAASRKLGPVAGQPLVLVGERGRGLVDEHVGEHVREVGDRRHQAVVGLGVDRGRLRAQRRDRAVQALVEDARRSSPSGSGTRSRRRTGRRARRRPRPSRRRPAGGRRRSADRRARRARRAWSSRRRSPRSPGPAAASTRPTTSGRAPTGAAHEGRVGALDRLLEARRHASIEHLALAAAASAVGRRVPPCTAAPSRSRAARPIEPPISPTPTTATVTQRGAAHAPRRRAAPGRRAWCPTPCRRR